MKAFDKSIFIGKFVEEATELIQKLNEGFLKLESAPDDAENLTEIFRFAHTLKGSSRMIGFKHIGTLAHKMEDVLGALKNQTFAATPERLDVLFQGLDRIAALVDQVKTTGTDDADVTYLIDLLEQTAAGEVPSPLTPDVVPPVANASPPSQLPPEPAASPSSVPAPKKTFDTSVFTGRFITEAQEIIQKLNEGLLRLEKAPDDMENLTEIFRSAHTLKGSARMLSFRNIGAVAHKMEDVLGAIKTKQIDATEPVCELLFMGLDTIQELVDRVSAGTEADADVSPLTEALEQAVNGEPFHLPQMESAPPVVPKPAETPLPSAAQPTARPQPEPEKPPTPSNTTSQNVQIVETIRVSTDKLDHTIKLAGELLVSQGQIAYQQDELRTIRLLMRRYLQDIPEPNSQLLHLATRIDTLFKQSRDQVARLNNIISDLQENTLNLRMQPISTIFDKYPRAVRDLAKTLGKQVRLVIEGEETELDKKIIEKLNDPLIHLIRNAIDHGIELPADRLRAGKDATGILRIGAYYESGSIVLEIEDDGKGINSAAIREKALKRGFITPEEADQMKENDLRQLIFLPGLTTTPIITDVSGRGVGMDVVRTYIEELKGTISIISDEGKGTMFRITLPLTLTMLRVLFIKSGKMRFAIPITSIRLTLRIALEEVIQIVDRDAFRLDNQIIPLTHLADLLQLPEEGVPRDDNHLTVVLAYAGEDQIGLVVDDIIDEEDVVVKSIPDHLGRIPNISGVTVTSTNEVVSILHVPDLIKTSHTSLARRRKKSVPVTQHHTPRILVVDDSLNTREIEKSVLEAYGYDVDTARDGQEGYDKCQKTEFDLIVTDVEMPRLNGFDLTAKLRQLERYRHTPIIIVTSLDTEADKQRGIEVGADAYIVKSSFEQSNLLSTVESLIG
ncbi:MAG: hybrid sensor histidine kinase/response regulator [Gemmatimonadetes bacterium]|nr:MAG: hybrid sensor histidine kinase/response regulator [Gemmatimonadota bacterium]